MWGGEEEKEDTAYSWEQGVKDDESVEFCYTHSGEESGWPGNRARMMTYGDGEEEDYGDLDEVDMSDVPGPPRPPLPPRRQPDEQSQSQGSQDDEEEKEESKKSFVSNVRRSLGRGFQAAMGPAKKWGKPSATGPTKGKEDLANARQKLKPATGMNPHLPPKTFNKPPPRPANAANSSGGNVKAMQQRFLPESVAKPTLNIKKKWNPRQKFQANGSTWSKAA